MAIRLKKAAQELLVKINSATAEAPFRIENVEDENYKALVAANFIQARTVMGDETKADAILSEDGKTRAKQYLPPENPRAPLPAAGSFTVFKLDSIPEKKPGRAPGNRSIYPFASITEPGTGFFVAATAERPEPWKNMRSTVSTINAKRRKDYEEAKAKDANAPVPLYFDLFEDTRADADNKPVKGATIYAVPPAKVA